MAEVSIKDWIKNFDDGKYVSTNIETQIEAGWYDWFCKDTSLANKTQILGKKLKMISKSKKIDINKQYVFFKNNCPMVGNLYNDFRICDIETDDVIYTIIPKSGFKIDNKMGIVWGKENNFEEPLFEGSWKDIKKWFLED